MVNARTRQSVAKVPGQIHWRFSGDPVWPDLVIPEAIISASGGSSSFPLWGFLVFLLYRMRRVQCKACGVVVEQVPWASGKHHLTTAYMQFLAHWARKLSWKDAADSFQTSWDKVCHAVEYVVEWGLAHRTLSGITAMGVDEIQPGKGQNYLTLVYQIDRGMTRPGSFTSSPM